MKKSIKLLAVAAIASMTIVACNNNKPAEGAVDTTAIEEVVEEEIIAEPAEVLDTTPVVEEAAQVAKKAVKKVAKETVKKIDENVVKEEVKATKDAPKDVQKTGKTSMKPKF